MLIVPYILDLIAVSTTTSKYHSFRKENTDFSFKILVRRTASVHDVHY